MLTKLGKFEIQKLLGAGSMGEIYIGTDPILGREVAIKTIHPAHGQAQEARDRFYHEARATGVLNHPNIVTVHEFGEDQGVLYIAMELVRGEDFGTLISAHTLSPEDLLETLAQVCDGLAYAHRQGVLHRDIKPSNVRIMLDAGHLHAKILDFGVAKFSNQNRTRDDSVFGTLNYMAPEYLISGKFDERSDLWAVGIMLYEACAGAPPFDAETPGATLYKLLHEEPKPLNPLQLMTQGPGIQVLIDRALNKDPTKRFQGAREMAQALREAKVASNPNATRPMPLAAAKALMTPVVGESVSAQIPTKPSIPTTPPQTIPKPLEPPLSKIEAPPKTSWVGAPAPPKANPESRSVAPSIPATPALTPQLPTRLEFKRQSELSSKPESSVKAESPAKSLGAQPRGVLEEARRNLGVAIASSPLNPQLNALFLVTLYNLGDTVGFREALSNIKRKGLFAQVLLETPRFRAMLETEMAQPRLPKDLSSDFLQYMLS